jgi:YVTN family beta-propeller protein
VWYEQDVRPARGLLGRLAGRCPAAGFVGRLGGVVALVTTVVIATSGAVGLAAPAASTVYVADAGANNVAVIDGATDTVTARIPVGKTPEGIAASPGGARVYTANECAGCSTNTVSVIDTGTDRVTGSVPLGDTGADAIAVTPDGTRAYVANPGPGSVSVINTSTNKVEATVPVPNATAIAISPSGTVAYVTEFSGNALATINIPSNSLGPTVPVGTHPSAVAVSPDGTRVYVANQGSDDVSVIDTRTDKVVATFTAGKFPQGIAVTPNGSTLYVANFGANNVWAVDAATGKREAVIPAGTWPWAVAVDPNGAVAYVANERSADVTAIDTATNAVLATIGTGGAPYAIAFGPPSWSSPASAATADTKDSPALAFYRGTLYAAWKAEGTDDVSYSANNGSAWSTAVPVSGTWGTAVTGHSPALVSYGSDLYAFWTTETGTVSYSGYNGTAWSAPATVPDALTDHGPAATTQEAKTNGAPPLLWVTWAAKATGEIWYTSYNGTSWASHATTLGASSATTYAPAMAEDFDSNAYIAWTASSGHVDWEVLIGLGEKVYRVPGALTSSGPALADTGHTLYFAFKGKSTDRVQYLGYDGSAYSSQQSVPRALTNVAPALANSGDTLCAGWKGATTDKVYDACLGRYKPPPSPPPVPTTTTSTPTTTGGPTGTVVTVTTGEPIEYSFEISTPTQPKVVSDEPAIELTVPLGEVTFNVTNPEDDILSHNFKVCSAPLPGPVTTLPGVQKLPDSCSGTVTPLLAPGGTSATLKVDFTAPGAYEYLSTAGGPDGDASAGMKGVLNVT